MMILTVNNLVTGSDINPKSSDELTPEQLRNMNKFVELQRTNHKFKNPLPYGQPARKLRQADLDFLASIKNAKKILPIEISEVKSPQGTSDYPFSPQKESYKASPNRYANCQDPDEEIY